MRTFVEKLARALEPECVNVVCPNMACREPVKVSSKADRYACPRCGNQWTRNKSGLLLGKRGSR